MDNLLLTRIDNRLVHGQVGVTWTRSIGANLLLVADDETAGNSVQQTIMKMTAESMNVGIRFFTIDKTIEVIHKASSTQKIFIIVKNPQDVVRLLEGGVPIEKVNVGNMHFSEGKKKLSTKVYVDDDDLNAFEKIKSFDVDLFIQDIPDEPKKKI